MTTKNFLQEIQKLAPFRKDGCLEAGFSLEFESNTYNGSIQCINECSITNRALGFKIDRIAESDGNEIFYVYGTNTKDGVYFADHERGLYTVEDLDTKKELEDFIEETFDMGIKDYTRLNADERMQLFATHCELIKLADSLEDFLANLTIKSK